MNACQYTSRSLRGELSHSDALGCRSHHADNCRPYLQANSGVERAMGALGLELTLTPLCCKRIG